MFRYRNLMWTLLVGMAWTGVAAGQKSTAPTPQVATLTCNDLRQCKGPDIHGKHFALLSAAHASVGARGERWGDYIRVQLIVSNASTDAVDFTPKAMVALTASGAQLHPAVVTELDTPSQGPGIMLGSGGPTTGYYPTVLGGVNPGSVIRVDPAGDAANKFDSMMHQHEAELRQMLTQPLTATSLSAGETVAGYVLLQPVDTSLPVRVKVPFAGTVFDLPLPAK